MQHCPLNPFELFVFFIVIALLCALAFLWMVLMAPVQYAKMAAFAATRLVRR